MKNRSPSLLSGYRLGFSKRKRELPVVPRYLVDLAISKLENPSKSLYKDEVTGGYYVLLDTKKREYNIIPYQETDRGSPLWRNNQITLKFSYNKRRFQRAYHNTDLEQIQEHLGLFPVPITESCYDFKETIRHKYTGEDVKYMVYRAILEQLEEQGEKPPLRKFVQFSFSYPGEPKNWAIVEAEWVTWQIDNIVGDPFDIEIEVAEEPTWLEDDIEVE